MSFGRFLLEEGVNIEVGSDIREVIAVLEREVNGFTCDNHGYRISPLKGVLGSKWKLQVKPWDRSNDTDVGPMVGLIDVEKAEGGGTLINIPPRDLWADEETRAFDREGTIFASLIFQLLNALQARGLIDLPGRLPVL